jgi:ribosome-associated translation inhibitor RaiA
MEAHETTITPAMEEYILQRLKGFSRRFPKVTSLTVRVGGEKKNGWALSISFEVHQKNIVTVLKRFFGRDLRDFYHLVNTAINHLYRSVEADVGKASVQRSRQRDGVRENKRTMYASAV